jgi:hypothetical protein
MGYARYETAKLGEINDDDYYFGAHCKACDHHARLSLRTLREHLGDAFPVSDIRKRLRCERCRSRDCAVTFLSLDQRGTNLVYLWSQPFR